MGCGLYRESTTEGADVLLLDAEGEMHPVLWRVNRGRWARLVSHGKAGSAQALWDEHLMTRLSNAPVLLRLIESVFMLQL